MKASYLVLIAVLVASVTLAGCVSVPTGEATLIVAIKDAPKTMDFGNVSHLNLTISEVSVHQANVSETAGWFVVVNQTQIADLIALQNVSQVLGQKTLEAGNYTQIRLKIDSGTVTVDNVTSDLTVPSDVLRLNRPFTLQSGATLRLTLDFDVEKSLIMTGSGQYKLEPVIAVIAE